MTELQMIVRSHLVLHCAVNEAWQSEISEFPSPFTLCDCDVAVISTTDSREFEAPSSKGTYSQMIRYFKLLIYQQHSEESMDESPGGRKGGIPRLKKVA